MIKLTRKDIRMDKLEVLDKKLKPYKIFIDDVYRGDIKNNETKEFTIDNGSHIIYAKIDWFRSNKISVDINNSIMELEVSASLTEEKQLWILAMPWFVTLFYTIYLIFNKNKYLLIKKIDYI